MYDKCEKTEEVSGEKMNHNFKEELYTIIENTRIFVDEPMKAHTTFRVGGPADYFVLPKTAEEVAEVIRICKKYDVPYLVEGNGSNLLVGDGGIRGVVLQVFKLMSNISIDGDRITAQAGASLAQVANSALAESLTGFEFAAGIPGTLGGAVVMNAGAYGGEMKDVLESVKVLTEDGEVQELNAEELKLGYRTSIIPEKHYIVLEATILLKKGKQEDIRGYMDELRKKRIDKQPLEYPSAGSTFKRPEGHFAGKLIQDAGLKGFTVGGAQVSEKHSGFVINRGDATAADILSLMEQVTERVKKDSGVTLEPEVKRVGEF